MTELVRAQSKAPRRTQSERSELTRKKVLEATIECLAELGYANFTSDHVAKRSGVTRGALHYHFGTKAEMVAAAFGTLSEGFAYDAAESIPDYDSDFDMAMAVLDFIWELHADPRFYAVLDVLAVSRTDPELRSLVVEINRSIYLHFYDVGRERFGSLVAHPHYDAILALVLTVIRGLLLMSPLISPSALQAQWLLHRSQLAALIKLSDETGGTLGMTDR